MKTKLLIIVCGAAALLAGILPLPSKQAAEFPRREVVILRGEETSIAAYNGSANCGDNWGYTGLEVVNSSSSAGAPTFVRRIHWIKPPCPIGGELPQPLQLSEAIAQLLSDGYQIQQVTLNNWFILVK